MTKLQPIEQLLEQLQVPAQNLAQLSFCDGSREASIKAWVNSLPATQIQFVSGLLYQAVPEIAHFKTGVRNRLNLLEALRLPCMQAIEGLSKSFLNQPLILPDSAVKTATIAQALQKHLISGYLITVRDFCKESSLRPEFIALGIHRAITGIGLLLLRYYQLYTPVSSQVWTELHSLFQIALHFDVTELEVEEPLAHHNSCDTITLAYTRILLLACCHPNQLRQDEIMAVYQSLNTLSCMAELQNPDSSTDDNLFAVALNSNHAPNYNARLKALGHRLILELNTHRLIKHLQDIDQTFGSQSVEHGHLRNELHLTPALTQHLIQTWNSLAQRHFDREQSFGILEVTVGISNIHYHLAGGITFTHFLNKTSSATLVDGMESIFQKRGAQLKDPSNRPKEEDPWGDSFDVSGTSLESKARSTSNIEQAIREQQDHHLDEAHPVHKVPLIDSSPGGYCIEWRDEIPSQVKAGELLGLRDSARNRWRIGVVRWANQTQGVTQLGIQILATQATPVGMAMIHKTGETSEYLRALEIPPMKAINQPATLITNAISFQEYSKARLYRKLPPSATELRDQNIQLTRRRFATGAFNQFSYRDLATNKPKEDEAWDS